MWFISLLSLHMHLSWGEWSRLVSIREADPYSSSSTRELTLKTEIEFIQIGEGTQLVVTITATTHSLTAVFEHLGIQPSLRAL